MTYDRTFQPILADGMVFWGSSVSGKVNALDLQTGNLKWDFYTEGPIRFAPIYWNNRVYVGSDDGYLYCLEAGSGNLIWKKLAGPNDRMGLGNGRMVSQWPIRGGAVIRENTLYFAAGIWPSDGIHLYALDPVTGKTIWHNDTAGYLYLAQPHGGAFANSGISAQGYLVASEDKLLVPTGRAVPAAFERKTGKFLYFHLQGNGHRGGSEAFISDKFCINNGSYYDLLNGGHHATIGQGAMAAFPGGIVRAGQQDIQFYQWANHEKFDRKGAKQSVRELEKSYRVELPGFGSSVIVMGDDLFAGGENQVGRINRQTGNLVWSAKVEGTALGLAADSLNLIVSTDQGIIYGFSDYTGRPDHHRQQIQPKAYDKDIAISKATSEIIRHLGVTQGFCLDLGSGDGSLAFDLASQTDLFIIAVEPDPELAAMARRNLSRAGIYGSRVIVLNRDPADSGLPIYFANLIVSNRSITKGNAAFPRIEAERMLRPYGGVLCVGKPGSMETYVRGALPGAGQWTHQYSNAANTVCSDDTLVKGPLSMLWYRDMNQTMVQRHGRGPAPLFSQGILYSLGLNNLVAVDAYNGTQIWDYPLTDILTAFNGDHLMGTSGTGSPFCLSGDSVFIRLEDYCLKIDARTGEELSRIKAPKTPDGQTGVWGFLAHSDGIIYGSLANQEHVVTYRYVNSGDMTKQLTESKTLFALDDQTGEVKWRYDAIDSIRHNTIAIGGDFVVLIDKPLAMYDRDRRGKPGTNEQGGRLVALNAQRGNLLWENKDNVYGTLVALNTDRQIAMMSYQPTRFRLASEIGGKISTFNLTNGERLWEKSIRYDSRPVINDQTIYAQGGAWDLITGEDRPFKFSRSYGCGILASAKDMMVYRSATLGYFDLTKNEENEDFGGIRPGCWINVIPAGGLVFAPDASAGCRCSYQNQAWIALQPDGIRPPSIHPRGGVYQGPVNVTVTLDHPEQQSARYTVDGSQPSMDSPKLEPSLKLTGSQTILARTFDQGGQASRVVSAEFIIDSNLLPFTGDNWHVWDAPGANPTESSWSIKGGVASQSSNIFVNTEETMSKNPAVHRPGTLRILQPENSKAMANGEISFEINSSDDDGVGFAFRVQDKDNYYLWTMHKERSFHSLARMKGGRYELLAENQKTYRSGQWHQVKIELAGPQITIYFDGEKELQVSDSIFPQGGIALYSWGNSGVQWRALKIVK
jgi:outer membrane protein assembly factor BamB